MFGWRVVSMAGLAADLELLGPYVSLDSHRFGVFTFTSLFLLWVTGRLPH